MEEGRMDTTEESTALHSFYRALQFFLRFKNWSVVCSGVKWKRSGMQVWRKGDEAWSNARLFLKGRHIIQLDRKTGLKDKEKIWNDCLGDCCCCWYFSRLTHFWLTSVLASTTCRFTLRPMWYFQLSMELEWISWTQASGDLVLRRIWRSGRFQKGTSLGWTSTHMAAVRPAPWS